MYQHYIMNKDDTRQKKGKLDTHSQWYGGVWLSKTVGVLYELVHPDGVVD